MSRKMLIAFLVGVVLAGCGRPRDLHLDEKANGRKIALRQGQKLSISLKADSGSGYVWDVAQGDAAILRQVGDMELESTSDMPGKGIRQTLRFEAVHAGATRLILIHHRRWEKGVALGAFSLDIVVR